MFAQVASAPASSSATNFFDDVDVDDGVRIDAHEDVALDGEPTAFPPCSVSTTTAPYDWATETVSSVHESATTTISSTGSQERDPDTP